MWSGVQTYLSNLMQQRIISALLQANPSLEPEKRQRLNDLSAKVAEATTSGDLRCAVQELRSCVIFMMQNVQDPDALTSLSYFLHFLPYGAFEEPFESEPNVIAASFPCPDASLAKELREQFGVTHNQWLTLNSEKQEALIRTLRYQVSSPGATCPICWDELFIGGKLAPDVVALFEEQLVYPDSERIVGPGTASVSIEALNTISDLQQNIAESPLPPPPKPFRFATQFVDAIFFDTVLCCVEHIQHLKCKSGFSESRSRHSLNDNFFLPCATAPSAPVPEYLTSRPYLSLSVFSHDSINDTTPTRRCSRLWTLTRQSSQSQESSPSLVSNSAKANLSFGAVTNVLPPHQTVRIRCHLFRGSFLRQWLNRGHWINPLTRYPVLPNDWCRLTLPDTYKV